MTDLKKNDRVTKAKEAFKRFEQEILNIRQEQKKLLAELERELSRREMEKIKKQIHQDVN